MIIINNDSLCNNDYKSSNNNDIHDHKRDDDNDNKMYTHKIC